MSDFLSQDQIDDLLNQGEFESADSLGGSGDTDAGGGGVGRDYGRLSAAFDIFCNQAGNVISAVLNKSVTISIEKCELADASYLSENLSAPHLVTNLPFKSGISEPFSLLLGTQDAAVMADLMLMGDGSAEYSEDHKDALGELFNQVLGAFGTEMGEKMGTSVSPGVVEVDDFDFGSPSISLDSADMVILSMTISDIGSRTLAVIVPAGDTEEIANALKVEGGDDGEGDDDNVGLNSDELDDLTKVADSFNEETPGGNFDGGSVASGGRGDAPSSHENIDMLLDVELDVCIELGRTDLSIKRILELAPGAIVELDRMAGEPVDLLVNDKVVAKGEVVVVDESFGIRIVSLVSPEERIRSLR